MDNKNIENEKVIQDICLDIYKDFKRICDKHQLRYYAIGGTCIGAVRHQGFIPWDDDMDIAMPYKDLVVFLEMASEELNSKYEIYSPMNCEHFQEIMLKIIDRNTTFIEKTYEAFPDSYRGIGIDVMPIWGMPKEIKKQKKMMKRNNMYIRLNRRWRTSCYMQPTLAGKLLWVLALPFKVIIPHNYWIEKMISSYSKYEFDNADKILFAWRRMPSRRNKTTYKSMFCYADFADYLELPFEDTSIRVPVGYDNYLTSDFGNYMEIPDENNRHIHDYTFFDPYMPYRKYAEQVMKEEM